MTLEGITNDGVEWELAFSGGDQSDVITHTLICAAESAASAAAIGTLTKLEFHSISSFPSTNRPQRILTVHVCCRAYWQSGPMTQS